MSTTPAPLDRRSFDLRGLALRAFLASGRGHLAPGFSLIEIVRVLYDHVLRFRPHDPAWPGRDRFILSKGHGCLGLYAILADKGYFPHAELDRFVQPGCILGGHPEAGKPPGVEASTGALGHGLPIGVGRALAAQLLGRDTRVFVLVGDGESNEGSNWEAAACAAKHRLSNLTVMVDDNKFQQSGPTSEIMNLEPMADKWRCFGFAVGEVDGHDVKALRHVLADLPMDPGKPSAIICHTVKGKGVSWMENTPDWHHNAVSPDQARALRAALEEAASCATPA